MLQSDCPCLDVDHSRQIPCAKISAHYETQPPHHHMIWPLSSFPVLPPTFTLPFSHLIYLPFIRHIKLLPGDTLVLVGLGCHNKIPKSWWLKQQKSILTVLEAGSTGSRFGFSWGPCRRLTDTTLPIQSHGHLCVSISHFYKDNNHTELETAHTILFTLLASLKAVSTNTVTSQGAGSYDLNTGIWKRYNMTHRNALSSA